MKYFIFYIVFLLSNFCYSQKYPKTIIIDSDTCIVFSNEQSKEMIKWDLEKEECLKEKGILQNELSLKDTVVSNLTNQILEYKKIQENQQIIIKENIEISKLYKQQLDISEKQLKKQKLKTFLYAVGGICTTSFMTYLYIQK